MHGSDGYLAGLVGGATLDGSRDDLARGLVGLGAHPLLGLAQNLSLVSDSLGANPVQQLLVRVLLREVGDALQL